jgi:hypothetical protein
VDAQVTASIGGYYATKSGYRLYHHAARLTGCAARNAKSAASAVLAVGTYAEGLPYRVRANYLRGTDTSNLDADSGFLDFMLKP